MKKRANVGESSLNHSSLRLLRKEELELLRAILGNHRSESVLVAGLEHSKVRDMQDGRMGSIKFNPEFPGRRRMAGCIAEADYMDADGVPVSIAINVDQAGRLFEVDIWKVDFSPLVKYPTPKTVRNVKHFDM